MGSIYREQPWLRRPSARRHESTGNDFPCVWLDAETQAVCLSCCLLLIYQICQLVELRRHQTDDGQLHVVYLCCGDTLSPKPAAHASSLVKGSPLSADVCSYRTECSPYIFPRQSNICLWKQCCIIWESMFRCQ